MVDFQFCIFFNLSVWWVDILLASAVPQMYINYIQMEEYYLISTTKRLKMKNIIFNIFKN